MTVRRALLVLPGLIAIRRSRLPEVSTEASAHRRRRLRRVTQVEPPGRPLPPRHGFTGRRRTGRGERWTTARGRDSDRARRRFSRARSCPHLRRDLRGFRRRCQCRADRVAAQLTRPAVRGKAGARRRDAKGIARFGGGGFNRIRSCSIRGRLAERVRSATDRVKRRGSIGLR